MSHSVTTCTVPTRTVTVTAPASTIIKFPPLSKSIGDKVSALLVLMESSKVFTAGSVQEIKEWRVVFESRNKIISTDDDRVVATNDLCFLLCDILEPILLEEQNDGNLITLVDFEKELTSILQLALPKKYNTTKEATEAFKNAALFLKKLNLIEALLEKLSQSKDATITKASEKQRLAYQTLLDLIEGANQLSKDASREANARFDGLAVKIDQVSKIFEENTEKSKVVDQKLVVQQAGMEGILKQAEGVIKETVK